MRIEQQIRIGRPLDEVWRFLADVPAVVSCIPGAELGESLGNGIYRGSFRLKVGPLSAKIEGESRVQRDDSALSGSIEGKGIDRRGGSRVSATMSYRLQQSAEGTVVDIAADLTLAGPLSQMGRTGLIEDVAKRLTEEFSEALIQRLTATNSLQARNELAPADAAPHESKEKSAPRLNSFDAGRAIRTSFWRRIRAWLARMFGA